MSNNKKVKSNGSELRTYAKAKAKNYSGDLLLAFIILALVIVFFIEALGYRITAARSPLVIMAPLSVLLLLHIFMLLKSTGVANFKKYFTDIYRHESSPKLLVFIINLIMLMVLSYYVGHYIGTLIFLFVILRFIARESLLITIGVSFLTPILLFIIFELLLGARLSRGIFYLIMLGYTLI